MHQWKPDSISIKFLALDQHVLKCHRIRLCCSKEDYIMIEIESNPSILYKLKEIKLIDSLDSVPAKWTIGACFRESSGIDIKYVPDCKVYQGEARKEKLQSMITFWGTDTLIEEKYRTAIIDELKRLQECDTPILFHCSSGVQHGASGSPCINIENGRVVGIYTGAIPKRYFDALSKNQQDHPLYLDNRLERAMCTNMISKSISDYITATERNSHLS